MHACPFKFNNTWMFSLSSVFRQRYVLNYTDLCCVRTPPSFAKGHLQVLWSVPTPVPIKSLFPHSD